MALTKVKRGVSEGLLPEVATIAEMEAIASPENGMSVQVTDVNRGGLFVFDTSATAAGNNGTTFKADDSTTGSWVRQYSGPVSVMWFGAVGDGAANDTTAFQNAMNHATGVVEIPDGTFSCNLLTPVSGVSLVGNGRGKSVIQLRAASNTQLMFGTSISDFAVRGLEIDGNKSNQSVAANLLQFFSSTGISIVDNHIHDATQDAVYFTGCEDCLVQFNDIADNDRNGVSCGAAVNTSTNIHILDNKISGHIGSDDIGISLEPSYKSFACRNVLVNNYDSINLAGDAVQTIDCDFNVVRDNIITATVACLRGIVVAGVSATTNRNLISGNKITGNFTRGIVALTTSRNTFSENIVHSLTGTNNTAFESISMADSLVSANRLYDCDLYGMFISSSDRNTITGNHVANNSTLGPGVRDGIRLENSSNNIVSGNYSVGADQAFGIKENGTAAGNTYSGNHVSGNASGGYGLVANSGAFVDGKLFATASPVTITGTTAETDLQTVQVPADVHKAYTGLRIRAGGTKTGGAGTKQLRLYFGSSFATFCAAANNTNDWRLEAEIMFVNSTNQRLSLVGYDGTTVVQDYGPLALNTASAQTLKCAGTLSNAADSIVGMFFAVEFIR